MDTLSTFKEGDTMELIYQIKTQYPILGSSLASRFGIDDAIILDSYQRGSIESLADKLTALIADTSYKAKVEYPILTVPALSDELIAGYYIDGKIDDLVSSVRRDLEQNELKTANLGTYFRDLPTNISSQILSKIPSSDGMNPVFNKNVLESVRTVRNTQLLYYNKVLSAISNTIDLGAAPKGTNWKILWIDLDRAIKALIRMKGDVTEGTMLRRYDHSELFEKCIIGGAAQFASFIYYLYKDVVNENVIYNKNRNGKLVDDTSRGWQTQGLEYYLTLLKELNHKISVDPTTPQAVADMEYAPNLMLLKTLVEGWVTPRDDNKITIRGKYFLIASMLIGGYITDEEALRVMPNVKVDLIVYAKDNIKSWCMYRPHPSETPDQLMHRLLVLVFRRSMMNEHIQVLDFFVRVGFPKCVLFTMNELIIDFDNRLCMKLLRHLSIVVISKSSARDVKLILMDPYNIILLRKTMRQRIQNAEEIVRDKTHFFHVGMKEVITMLKLRVIEDPTNPKENFKSIADKLRGYDETFIPNLLVEN